MATGESAFRVCIPTQNYDSYMTKTKSSLMHDGECSSSQAKHASPSFNKNRKSGKDDLVNIKTSKKKAASCENFSYLLKAYRIIEESLEAAPLAKKECEYQSSNSQDDTNCSILKRFERTVIPSLNPITDTIPDQISVKPSSDMISDQASCLGKQKKFGDRPDVIYKTILRSFKKFYLAKFNEVTDYKKKKRRVTNHSFLVDMSLAYVREELQESPFEDLELFISALVQPKLPPQLESNAKLFELSRVVGEVLYRFNKSKMQDLLTYPQFSYLLKKFLSIPDLIEFIGERSTSPQAVQNLKAQISFLMDKCNEVLSFSGVPEFANTKLGANQRLVGNFDES